MRKGKIKRRKILPDPKFDDTLVTRFINNMMYDGKKSIAFDIFYDALDIVDQKKENKEKTSLEIWKEALSNVMPHVEVRSKRIGGSNYQIPIQIGPHKKITMAMKWLIQFSRKRNEKSMSQKLASEIIAASKEEGGAVKKKLDTHRMADANKAFAHLRY